MLNIGDTFFPNKPSHREIGGANDPLINGYATPSSPRSTGRKDSAVRGYATRTATNLRSIVERRFMRMSEAHDRIRRELLASHSSNIE